MLLVKKLSNSYWHPGNIENHNANINSQFGISTISWTKAERGTTSSDYSHLIGHQNLNDKSFSFDAAPLEAKVQAS